MSTFALWTTGTIFVGTLGVIAYFRFVWKLPVPWRYIAATWVVAAIGLFVPWVAIIVVGAFAVLGAADRSIHGS